MTATAAMPTTRPTTPRADVLPRLLTGPTSWAAHRARHGAVPWRGGPLLLLATLEQAGLTGRGGAGFPTARKWRAVAQGRGPAVVVGNGAEGEPASRKDRTLLELNPHLVLDGLQLAAEAVGAPEALLYVKPVVAQRVQQAVAERRDDRVSIWVVQAADRFLAGEESAVVDALQGGPGLPRSTPPRVFERGVHGRPTLVQNVETLAHVALAARYGADWFRTVGTPDEPGSLLVTVQDVDRVPRVGEVPHGIPLNRLVDLDAAQAVLVGGYHGTWLAADAAAALTLTRRSLAVAGATPGAGVLVTLPPGACGLVETSRALTYLATESAGQCGPCLNGLPRIAVAMESLAARRASADDVTAMRRWAGLVAGRGACHHPDGTVRMLRSALTAFDREVGLHLRGGCTRSLDAGVLPVPVRGTR
jgi:NADH:ubiquinone oxidoreductase subunit F (NADH-binding)